MARSSFGKVAHPASSSLACILLLSVTCACGDSAPPADARVSSVDGAEPDAQDAAPTAEEVNSDAGCHTPSARLGVDYFERFGDGVDSNCDGQDDPAFHEKPCSCAWLDPGSAPSVSRCGDGFNPHDAHGALADAGLGAPTCEGLADLRIVFAVQCTSECLGVPIYVAIGNVGGARSGPARIGLRGSFRHGRPNGSLAIEPLDPGQFTPLMDISATGDYRIDVETDQEDCNLDNNAIEVDAYDAHCGFF